MKKRLSALLLILPLLISCGQKIGTSTNDYLVTDFGAVADGKFLNSRTIQGAIDYISANGGGRLIFPAGEYVCGTIYLKNDVTLHLEKGASLLGSNNPFDYVKDPAVNWMSFIFAIRQKNVGITGEGTINGRGFKTAYEMCEYIHKGLFEDDLNLDRPREWNRPQNVYFRECENVTIQDITLRDPASWNQTYEQCTNVLVERIKVDSKSYWNNDGIDIIDCNGVQIRDCFIDAADDIYCFKSHTAGKICENVLLENCVGRSSANGVKFGTVSKGGFRNFEIRNIKMYDTFRSAVTFASVDGGIIENINVDGIEALNTGNAIFLRTGLRWNGGRIGSMKGITIKNVYVEVPAGKPDAGYSYEGPIEDLPRNISPSSIVGIPEVRIQDVTLENIKIVYPGDSNPNYAYRGTTPDELASIPEMPASYPEFSQFKELPAWAFYIRHADNIVFKNVTFVAQGKEYRPAIVADDVNGLVLQDMTYEEPESEGKAQVVKNNVR